MAFIGTQHQLARCLLVAALAAVPASWHDTAPFGAALADDDDDDDDDDRGGGARRDGNRDDSPAPRRTKRKATVTTQAPARRAPVAAVERPAFAPELVTLGLSAADLGVLTGEGYRLLGTSALPGTTDLVQRLAPPPGVTLADARSRMRALPSGAASDFNHYYRTEQAVQPASAPVDPMAACTGRTCAPADLIAWPGVADRAATCGALPRIGIIDTGVNAGHDLIARTGIEVVTLADTETDSGQDPSSKVHGTAVLSVLAGQPGSRVEGLLPEASYLVADIFTRQSGDERADVVSLIRGLDLMAERGVRVVNLSLTGPANTALENMLRRLVDTQGMILLGAVDNGGAKAKVAYPAAYDGVIGVTAVDRRGRLYRSAQRGAAVDLAAPGVGLLLATSVSGAREKTGTSFAVPFATAAAALIVARNPDLSPDEVARRLTESARDLGKVGPDWQFGHGLLQAEGLCR